MRIMLKNIPQIEADFDKIRLKLRHISDSTSHDDAPSLEKPHSTIARAGP